MLVYDLSIFVCLFFFVLARFFIVFKVDIGLFFALGWLWVFFGWYRLFFFLSFRLVLL